MKILALGRSLGILASLCGEFFGDLVLLLGRNLLAFLCGDLWSS